MRCEKQFELMQARVAALEELAEQQGEINAKILLVLRQQQEQDKAPASGLILPDRLN